MVATRSSNSTNIVTLDNDTSINVFHFAEGAANIVFKISSKRGDSTRDDDFGQPGTTTEDGISRIDHRLKGKLLRLRKDLPSATPVAESHQYFVENIKPLFPTENLVEQVLCKITPKFVRKCNEKVRDLEAHGLRPTKRKGVYLAENEPYATAITDMRCDEEHASCEFKPKWLAQSPTAPPDSKRCRTCALRAMRSTKDARFPELTDFCPLTLVDDKQEKIAASLERLLGHSRGAPLNILDFVRQLHPYFQQTPLLKLLRDLQTRKDPNGVLKADPSNLDFVTAMTLRDCTLFLKIPNRDNTEAHIEARLGDLDLKTPDGNKAQYWRQTEQQLIDE
ncbi:MAG: hypothetical protein Q9225_002209, partial [Loekoesia sp. 1 TL-2023]